MRYLISGLEKQSGTLQVILFLNETGEVNFKTMMDELGLFYNVLYRALGKLKELDLIIQRTDSTARQPRNMISLTAKGRKVAEKLREIEETLIE